MKKLTWFLISIAMLTTNVFGQVSLNETFDSNPTLSAIQAAGVWYVDRYAPAAFQQNTTQFPGENVLQHSIDGTADGSANRGAQDGTFYNTQGRKYDLGLGITKLYADIYIPASFQNNNRRAGMWGTAHDGSASISSYPILSFRNVDGSSPKFSYYSSDLGDWVDLSTSITYDSWYSLEIELNISTNEINYYINGALEGTDAANYGNEYFDNIIIQAYNFNHPDLPVDQQSSDSYDVFWDNIKATGPVHNITQDLYYVEIQPAIDDANAGDVIEVSAGTYDEVLLIDKPLSLFGPNDAISAVDGTRVPEARLLQRININEDENVTVSGFEFFEVPVTNTWTIYIYGNSNNFTFRNNRFIDCDKDAIRSGMSSNTANVTVTGNLIQGIKGSLASGFILGGINGTSVISDNKIDLAFNGSPTGYAGIQTPGATGLTISGNEISNTTNQGIQLAGACGNVTIENNTISNTNTSEGSDKGAIRLYGTDFIGPINITGNTLTNSFNGIAVKDGQNISGINITVNDNDLSGNSNNGIYNGGTGTLNATFNYWGTSPDFNTLISGSVDYCPWYTDAAMTTTQGCPPVKNLTQVKYYQNIQPAVDEANAGDVIEVGDGTYVEDVEILTDDITLQSKNGAAVTIIDANNAVNAIKIGEYDKNGIHPTGLTIDGFTVQGWTERGIGQRNGNGTINVLNNTIVAPTSGTAVRGAIILSGGDGSLVKGNTVSIPEFGQSGWSSAGIMLLGTKNATVQDNYVNGLPSAADIGIIVVGAAQWANIDPNWVEASGNIIKNNVVEDTESGIDIAGNTSNTTVIGNDVMVTDVGVRVYEDSYQGTPSGSIINFNKLSGLNNSTNINVDAINNWWGDCSGPSPLGDTRCTETAAGSGGGVSCFVDFDPWVGKGSTNAALWLSPATLAGNSLSNVPLWEGISCASLDAVMSDGNRQPLYDSFVNFSPDPYWVNSDAMEVPFNQDVTTSITQVNGNGQVSKSIFVVFTPDAPSQGTQFIFEIGGQKSGMSMAIQNEVFVAGMWNPWERKFWAASSTLNQGETYLAEVQFVRDETVSPIVSKFRVILNGDASSWINFYGLIEDQSETGIGAGVKGTALRNVYYSHNYINHFDGNISEVIVMNNQTETESADMYNDLMSSYGLTGATVTPKQTWNLEVWENIALEEDAVNIYPNPAVESATLELSLTQNSNVTISLNTIDGRFINNVHNGQLSQGMNVIDIDTKELQSGVYNLVIEIDGNAVNKQIVVVK